MNEVFLKLQSVPTDAGFDILPINAGLAKGHGLTFSASVLMDSLPMWDNLPCFLDHDYTGTQSVRHLAGALHNPSWNEQEAGIQASLIPGGPGAKDLQALRQAARSDPAIMEAVGFSAHLFLTQQDGVVKRITKVRSVDCVIDPARGGRFLAEAASSRRQLLRSHEAFAQHPRSEAEGTKLSTLSHIVPGSSGEGEPIMKVKIRRNGKEIEVEEAEILATDERSAQQILTTLQSDPDLDTTSQEAAALLQVQAAQKSVEVKSLTAAESLRQVRLRSCTDLLKVSLQASGLPGPSAARVNKVFSARLEKGLSFEPSELDSAIAEEQTLLSELTASGTIQGPSRISNMHSSSDQLEAAVSDLFGVERDAKLTNIKPAHLSGIRELYLMLTGDYDLHGGFYGERIQLATTADFSGLVKNALNKVVTQQWDALGNAGYNWWEKICKIEHFNNLNTITGTLIGTVGALPTVAEGAEYTELAVGDSPETADFTKYGGYIPLTLELIDRDDTRKLKAYASELGSAARRKISSLVSQVFLANTDIGPTMADGGALFNNTAVTAATGHANLLVTALGTDYAQWNIVALAMFNQPMLIKHAAGYYGTGPKMAVWPKFCIVPPALRGQAEALFVPRWASNVTAIPSAGGPSWGGMVEVVVMPEFVEVDHWAAAMDPAIAPAIIVGERFGIKPEIFTAGNELSPAVFMNDEHRIKVRMFTAVLVQDFRPLHKENV